MGSAGRPSLLRQLVQHSLYAHLQLGDLVLSDIPDFGDLHAKVHMHDEVAKPGDQTPRHFVVHGANRLWKLLHRLADDGEVSKHSIDFQVAAGELLGG